jgi:hypothetical protein
MNEQLRFVTDCGYNARTVFYNAQNNEVVIGCFKGSFDETREAIVSNYGHDEAECNAYLAKIDELEALVKDENYIFDPDEFDWEEESGTIARYAPQHFDTEFYNWEWASAEVAEHCPEHFNPKLFDWEGYSWIVAKYCPEHFDPERYNWKADSWAIPRYCPEKMKLKPKGK